MRAGICSVIIPKLNEKDLPDLPPEVKEAVKFLLAETVDEVLTAALDDKKTDAPAQAPNAVWQDSFPKAA